MEGQKALRFHQKYLNLCSEDERMSYGFWTTWGWVINYRIFIFGWTIPLSCVFARWKNLTEHWVSIHKDKFSYLKFLDREAKLFLLCWTFYWKYSVFTCWDFYLLSLLLQTCKSCDCGVWVGEDIPCKRGVCKDAIKTYITFCCSTTWCCTQKWRQINVKQVNWQIVHNKVYNMHLENKQ